MKKYLVTILIVVLLSLTLAGAGFAKAKTSVVKGEVTALGEERTQRHRSQRAMRRGVGRSETIRWWARPIHQAGPRGRPATRQ